MDGSGSLRSRGSRPRAIIVNSGWAKMKKWTGLPFLFHNFTRLALSVVIAQ